MSEHTKEPWNKLVKMIAKDFNLLEDAVENQINCWKENDGKSIVSAYNNTHAKGISPERVPEMLEALEAAKEEILWQATVTGHSSKRWSSVLGKINIALAKKEKS